MAPCFNYQPDAWTFYVNFQSLDDESIKANIFKCHHHCPWQLNLERLMPLPVALKEHDKGRVFSMKAETKEECTLSGILSGVDITAWVWGSQEGIWVV